MKKFIMKKLPKVSETEHRERMKEYGKYKKIYKIARSLGESKEKSKSIAAISDPIKTIKNRM